MVRHLFGETFLILRSMKKDLFPEIEMHYRVFFSSHRKEWKSIAILTILLSCQISTSCSPTLQTVLQQSTFFNCFILSKDEVVQKHLRGKSTPTLGLEQKKIRVFFTVFVFAFQASHGDELTKKHFKNFTTTEVYFGFSTWSVLSRPKKPRLISQKFRGSRLKLASRFNKQR